MIGRTVSHYEIVEKIGEGGMGVVYKAHDTRLDRDVALKFLSSPGTQTEELKQRFIHEAKAASSLDHPNICSIYEIDETSDGQLYIAMRAYDGVSLNKKIQSGSLTPVEIIDYALQIVSGLQAAHEKGIVHRDIKSGNIIITSKGEVKIIDFGLAKLRGGIDLTRTGKVVGSLAYMSPEQLRADKVDVRSDIFSFGVVLYEMITGKLPFKGEYEEVVMYSIIYQDPAPITGMRSDVPGELERIVMKCLEKNPDTRYQNTSELYDDLARLKQRSERPTVSGIETGRRVSSYSGERKPKKFVYLLVAALIVLMVLSYPYLRQSIYELTGSRQLPSEKSLAVLPFRAISDYPGDQDFCLGLVEILTSKITQMELAHRSLLIVPSIEIRNRGITSAREAQIAFGVTLAIDGSVYRAEQEIHITMNLIDVQSLRQLDSWSTVVDKNNMADLSNRITVQIAKMIDVELRPQDLYALGRGNTKESRAYELYIQARGLLQRYSHIEEIREAIRLFDEALKIDRTYALAYAGIGEAYWRMYDETKDTQWIDYAVTNTRRALELNDDIPSVHVSLGLILRGTGEYEKAIQSFQRAIEIDPVNWDALSGLARTYETIGNYEEANNVYQRIIRLRPSFWVGYNMLGVFYYRRASYEDAIIQFSRVTELAPNNYLGYMNLGVVYFEMDDWKEARRYFERAIEMEPQYRIYSNLGTIYFYEAMYENAIISYEKALEIRDHEYWLWGNLASAYYWSGKNYEKAMELYRQAALLAEKERDVNPRNSRNLVRLAGYYTMLGDSTAARRLLNEALQIDPHDISIMSSAGPIFEQLGDRETALHLITTALKQGASLAYIENDPLLHELRKDPNYIETVRELEMNRN
jgi:serine/threonine protein kinase/tetratricopeptide (TPR) repeat protein